MSRDFDFSNLNSCLSWNGLQKGRVALAFLGMAGLCCPGVQPRDGCVRAGGSPCVQSSVSQTSGHLLKMQILIARALQGSEGLHFY